MFVFTGTTLWEYSADHKLMIISLFVFQKKSVVKAQEKISKIFQNNICWYFYPECQTLIQ